MLELPKKTQAKDEFIPHLKSLGLFLPKSLIRIRADGGILICKIIMR